MALNRTESLQEAFVYDANCSRERAYLAIVITVLPLWAILTTLIVFILFTFHKNSRATKIYDNCNRASAVYTYHIELRTGDTSSNYNRRRTTLTIDMFDDNQTTLARIAIPGHVIFGRKENPIGFVDDEKYSELRVTRFWVHRAQRLKNVATIRLTHSCLENEAKIMVYGVEIRTNERDKYKLFFPVMNYITAYGSVNKPNACFDLEHSGSISAMGGSQADFSSISAYLSWVDSTILVFLLVGIIFYLNTFDLVRYSFIYTLSAISKGSMVGLVSFTAVFAIGLLLRFLIKHYYSLRIGLGFWAFCYYISCTLLIGAASALWIYSTIKSYRYICPDRYNAWGTSIGVAIGVASILGTITWLAGWLIQLMNPKSSEQYVMPDEVVSYQKSQEIQVRGRQSMPGYRYGGGKSTNQITRHQSPNQQSWPVGGANSVQVPVMVPAPVTYNGGNVYNQPTMMGPLLHTANFKTIQTSYDHQPNQLQTYGHQQTNIPTNPLAIKQQKKIGSSESTGSTYYQQLMKNKGGVKSISQYGELLKQKKTGKNPKLP